MVTKKRVTIYSTKKYNLNKLFLKIRALLHQIFEFFKTSCMKSFLIVKTNLIYYYNNYKSYATTKQNNSFLS